MKHRRSSAIRCACLTLIWLACVTVYAGDWPQWRGPGRDGKAAFDAPETWPKELARTWTVNVGPADATPALVGDRLYVFARQGNEEVTLCLDAATGQERWTSEGYPAPEVTGGARQHPGPRSSPAVGEGKVVTLGVGGVLSCLDADSGKLIWRTNPFPQAVPQFFTSSSPLIADGLAIAQLGATDNGAILAFDLATGQEKWRWAEEGPEYASPVLLTVGTSRQVVALTGKSVMGVSLADGALLWKLPFASQRRAYNAATPIVDGTTVIYTGAGRGTFAVKIEPQGDAFTARPLWDNPDVAPQFNTPVLKEGALFGLSSGGNPFCLDARTGRTHWLADDALDRRGFGALVDGGSCLVALPAGGELVVFAPDTEKYRELARFKVSETPTYAHPILDGRRIFIKDRDTLTLWTIE